MPKPINENIRSVMIEDENGNLIPVLDHAGEEFAKLINAVVSNGKGGSVTIKVEVKPSTAGALAVKAAVSTKIPRGLPRESLLWPTPEGNLMAEDPKQTKLDLRPVQTEPTPVLKTVSQA